MDYRLDDTPLSAGTLYRLFSGGICPRPIAWVATQDAAGTANLAPFSFFNVASVNPPVLAFAPLRNGDGELKDTVNNLNAVPECVIHVGTEALVEALNATSATVAPHEDEFVLSGLDKASMPGLGVPRIAQAPLAFGCRLRELITLGDAPLAGTLVLAEVVSIHIDDALWDGRHVDMDALGAIGRLAGNDFVRTHDRFALQRPG
ncbi:flavin reductase family protein [Halomonas dongshanensis]|uniref:Flavin reductase family protein n=1 Tax=Halomonas dongshanensis TaxID=2890835 RepID=A0ABT2EBI6_9GAMM|nr:flavin reductase family protein [Halomonas dongshanensis]MCS2608718.1 flavin reductase family protein [Halomonas dongshanensis]